MEIYEKLKILLVEDNASDMRLLCKALGECSSRKFDVVCVTRLKDGISALTSQNFDAIILDLSLPDCQGLDTLNSILQTSKDCPVVVLTGLADEAIGVEAIRKGAEEYLIKGEVLGQSIARFISLTVERRRRRQRPQDASSTTFFRIGTIEIDLIGQEVTLRKDESTQAVYLTPIEFRILALLARNQGAVLPRSRIVAEVWREDSADQSISVRTLDKHVSSLKKKCAPALEQLQSVYGVGYSLDLSDTKKIARR